MKKGTLLVVRKPYQGDTVIQNTLNYAIPNKLNKFWGKFISFIFRKQCIYYIKLFLP